jgi:hypothetical protein
LLCVDARIHIWDDRVLAAVEDVDPILGVCRDARDVAHDQRARP